MERISKIESWWQNAGIADRIQASGIWATTDMQDYFRITDDWWHSRTDKEKKKIYKEFYNTPNHEEI